MDTVLQYSPLLLDRGEEEEELAEQVFLSAPCQDVVRTLPASADTPLLLRDVRQAAMHGCLRPHLFGELCDEQLLEVVKFLDFWELPQSWLQMAQAERGARLRPAILLQRQAHTRPLDAYSSESATWALCKEVQPLLQPLARVVTESACWDVWTQTDEITVDAQRAWAMLRLPPRPSLLACLANGGMDTCGQVVASRLSLWWRGHSLLDSARCALHILCGARQPELLVGGKGGMLMHMLRRTMAMMGDLEALQWLRANGAPWDAQTCAHVAGGGHLHVLQRLREEGCPWDARWDTGACSQAAGSGHLAVLQWLRQHGFSWNEYTCMSAAGGGHLAVLQWLREHGCPWDGLTCSNAAAGGHLFVLQWARAHGCPWNKASVHASARSHADGSGGHEAILQWLRSVEDDGRRHLEP